jgi:hypothetical protein
MKPLGDAAPKSPPPSTTENADNGSPAPEPPSLPIGGDPSGGALSADEPQSSGEEDSGSPGPQTSETPPTDTQSSDRPPIDWTVKIPGEEPSSTQQLNQLLRSIATWLGRAVAVLGAAYSFDPEVEVPLAAIDAALWMAEYLPKIFSYLDDPKTLEELQGAVADPRYGYEIHHIVEAQLRSEDPQRNSLRFSDRINAHENLVRIPYWKHVEISSWYSTRNWRYNWLTPREYLRGKDWSEQYKFGLSVLRNFQVLK